jgi:hypothetical protein
MNDKSVLAIHPLANFHQDRDAAETFGLGTFWSAEVPELLGKDYLGFF